MTTAYRKYGRLHSVLVVTVLSVFLSVFALPAARADKYKTPDQTLDDHPSGKDRSTEPGTSGDQGKAKSDPDANTNGGADKPGMSGGYDTDRDGNNGCGNDDDFEDDNNGWCGHHPRPTAAVHAAARTAVKAAAAEVEGLTLERTAALSSGSPAAARVLGETFERTAAVAPSGATVLGSTTTRAAAGSLARTGSGLGPLALLALVMIALGLALATGAAVMDRRRLAPVRVRMRR